MTEWQVNVSSSGEIKTVYTDALDLQEIGQLCIERASNVEWCNELQCWLVDIVPGQFQTRSDAIAAEIAYLHSKVARGEI